MYIRQGISVANLLLDLNNYRHGKAASQKEARDAIIAEQGKKLVNLAKDIVANGLNPFDLPLVVDAEDGNKNYTVIEGNRRLTAVNLMLKPDLAEGTAVHAAFKRLNKNFGDSIPKVFDCVIAPNKHTGLIWINRKHANGLEGAGTEHWSSIAKARADVDQGISRLDLDAVNFVLTSKKLPAELRHILEGSKFNITTLERLLTTKETQDALGISVRDGKLVTEENQSWVRDVLTDIVSIVATGTNNGEKFTERDIDTSAKRSSFVAGVISHHPKQKKADSSWSIAGKPASIKISAQPAKKPGGSTLSTEEQPNLIPKKFKLELPSGKINDIFVELKKLDVVGHRHAVSVLFRVFFELSLEHYINKKQLQPKSDKLIVRLQTVVDFVKSEKILTDAELKPMKVAISDPNSLVATETLNAYVHSAWLNPDPTQLKIAWANIQRFIECLWQTEN
jgi:hypothetical protein